MVITQNAGVTYSIFPNISKTELTRHGCSTRLGGVSDGIYKSMNLGYKRGDDTDNVTANFRGFTQALGVNLEDTVFCAQVHGANLRRVEAADRGKGFFPSDIKQTDGLYTNVPNLALATFSADCAPILFLDPVKKVIAAIHSGWRGTAARIAQKLIAALNKEFKSNPADILAGIGPSIGPCCFEVDSPVAEQFSDWREFIIEGKAQNKEKFNVDLWRINESMLIEAGLKPENIDCAPLCTCCNSDLYFSHRRDKDARGSMASIISLGV